jgi:hypothetical protein
MQPSGTLSLCAPVRHGYWLSAAKPVPPPTPILKPSVEVSAPAEVPAHPVQNDEATR